MTKTPDTWDPEPWQRIYVRHGQTADLGYLVRRDGKDLVRLDRPNQEVLQEYDAHHWTTETAYRPVSHVQVVQVAFAADQVLLKALGQHAKARKNWHEISEKQRKAWLELGPSDPPKRAQLYKAIVECLEAPP
jgi:hypothetical protein